MIDTIIIVIIIVLLWFALKKSIKHFKGEETCCNSKGDTINKKELVNPIIGKKVIKIEGMHCNHCKQKVTSALNNLEGVSTDVDLKNNCAVISYDREIDEEIIKNTLKNAGYSVVLIKML
ncbi:heavy-metal-associated domain-containing protein [Thomasclavelia spiroformis]|uniref:heavy-metal-associated domain-containing protein n=1 Tax=Thomasclavelia spiroformis TaxID=29348 RepID=UPI00241D3C78|nr:heavy metal-associated domain-containing protein [Thomasclavelia spiroformis]